MSRVTEIFGLCRYVSRLDPDSAGLKPRPFLEHASAQPVVAFEHLIFEEVATSEAPCHATDRSDVPRD